MNNDIVARLRWDYPRKMSAALMDLAADEIERLRAERDEARREVCEMISDADESSKPESAEQVANRRGWDCFKEDKEDTDD